MSSQTSFEELLLQFGKKFNQEIQTYVSEFQEFLAKYLLEVMDSFPEISEISWVQRFNCDSYSPGVILVDEPDNLVGVWSSKKTPLWFSLKKLDNLLIQFNFLLISLFGKETAIITFNRDGFETELL